MRNTEMKEVNPLSSSSDLASVEIKPESDPFILKLNRTFTEIDRNFLTLTTLLESITQNLATVLLRKEST